MNNASSERTIDRLLQRDLGLELRRWTAREEWASVAAVLAPYAIRPDDPDQPLGAETPDELDRLGRNGFRWYRVPTEELESLRGRLNDSPAVVSAWHGQAPGWRELMFRPLDLGGQVMFVDGRTRWLDDGRLRLLGRTWLMPTENGPVVYLELAPQHAPPRAVRRARLQIGPWRDGDILASGAMAVSLRPGDAYILAGVSPGAPTEIVVPDDADAATPADPPAVGPADAGVGPAVLAPTTIGEGLLASSFGRETYELLVFVPRAPDALDALTPLTDDEVDGDPDEEAAP